MMMRDKLKDGMVLLVDLQNIKQYDSENGLGRRSYDHKRQIKRWNSIAARLKEILNSMNEKSGGTFDDHYLSPTIGQVLLYWGYELIEKDLFDNDLFGI